MPIPILRTISVAASTVGMLQSILYFFTGDSPKEPVAILATAKIRKKRDTTKLTQRDYDFICKARAEWVEHNDNLISKSERLPLQRLVEVINLNLGMDKSTRALGRVWSGEISRDSLPTGEKYLKDPS
jgi:hypothetical protein